MWILQVGYKKLCQVFVWKNREIFVHGMDVHEIIGVHRCRELRVMVVVSCAIGVYLR